MDIHNVAFHLSAELPSLFTTIITAAATTAASSPSPLLFNRSYHRPCYNHYHHYFV